MRSHFPIVPSLPFAAACTLLASFGLLPAPARAAQTPLLPTLTNNLAGTTTDIAGPADASSAPDLKRVWIAEGRVRTAIRISDRQRMFVEDRSFSSSVSAETYEPLIALEVDDVNQRLYTLTKDALYREDISTPSSPASLDFYDFSPATGRPVEEVISSWEPAVDLKVWPQGGGLTAIFVLTEKRLITLLDAGPGIDIVLAGWTSDLYDPYLPDPENKILPRDHCSPVDVATLKVYKLQNLRALEDQQNGQVMAYVTAEMAAYPAGVRPFPRLVIACYLDSQNGYASPSFDLDPNPSRIHFYYWSPMPPPNPPPPGLNADKTIYSLDAFASGPERYLYLACGKDHQMKRIKVTNAYPKTDCSTWTPDATYPVDTAGHVYNVLADRAQPTRFFSLSGFAAHIIDTTNTIPPVTTINEPFGFGCRRDMLQIALPSPLAKTLWSATDGYVDYVCKVLDVTASPTTIPVVDEYFALLNCDGGVMIGTDVYLPTWNGLVRHRWIASESRWEVVPSSYRPAEVPPDSGAVFSTEHAEAGFVNSMHRVFIAPGLGQLLEFEIPTTSPDPDFPRLFNPVISPSWPTGWHGYPDGAYYSNDVAFVDLGPNDDQKFVLVDLTNFAVAPLTTQPALLAYRYDPVALEWDHVADAFATPIVRQNPDAELTNTITIAPGLNNKWFAFVAHDMGFFSVDITDLTAPTPGMAVVSQVCSKIDPMTFACVQGAAIAGLTVSMDRLFVYVNGTPKTIRIYHWNRLDGMVGALLQEYPQSYFLPPDPNPVDPSNATSGRCFRARFHTTNAGTGAGYAYFACEPYLLQMYWPGSGASTLDFTGWWRSDYEAHLQDCRFYDVPGFASGILTVKDGESFALVGE
jgi:hypothetical protein